MYISGSQRLKQEHGTRIQQMFPLTWQIFIRLLIGEVHVNFQFKNVLFSHILFFLSKKNFTFDNYILYLL